MNLFQALGEVPPGVPTAPTSTMRNSSARATCQPPRLPAAALRQTCAEKAEPAAPISRATSTIVAAGTPLSARRTRACTGRRALVSTSMNVSNVCGSVGMLLAQILFPVDPAAHELAIVTASRRRMTLAHRQQHRGLAAGPGRKPVVGLRGGVGEARIHHADSCARVLRSR